MGIRISRPATALCILLCVLAPLSAGGGGESTTGESETVVLRMYTQYSDDSERIPKDIAIENLRAVMPNVEVQIEVRAQDDGLQIRTFAASGALPDIFDADGDIIEAFRASNNIHPLNEVVDELGVLANLSPATVELMYHEDGNIYAVPTVGPWVALLYYNRDVFEEHGIAVPTNYQELLPAVERLREAGIVPLSLFAREKWPGVQLFDMIATRYAPGGIVALDRGEARMSDPPYRRAVERLKELIDAGLIAPGAFSTAYDQAYAQFVEGRAAMLLNGAWQLSALYDDLGEAAGFFEGYPFADTGSDPELRWRMSGGPSRGGIAVSPYSENLDVAARYAALFAMETAKAGTVEFGFPPIAADSPEPRDGYNPLQRAFWSEAGNITSTTAFTSGIVDPVFRTALEDNIQNLMADTIGVEEFISLMDRAIQGE